MKTYEEVDICNHTSLKPCH